jgi:hypothetical protein
MKNIIFCVILIPLFSIGQSISQEKELLISKSFESDEFDMYVEKFYRDANFHGIFPVKPEKIIIKFSYFDRIKSRTHVHGSSYGFNNDDLIEIYINKTSWDNFNKAQRYHIMYHELGHDVLNLPDFDKNVQDKNAIMYPSASSGGYYLMDDFIVSMKRMFKNYKPTEKKIENKQKTLNGLKIVYPKGFTKISSDDTGEVFKNDNISIATVSGPASFGEKEALELIKSDLGGNKYIRHSVIEDFKIKFPIGHYLSSSKSIVTTSIFIINDNFYAISIEIKPKTSIQKLEDAQKIMKKGNLLIVEMITNFISEEDFTDAKHKELLSVYPIIKGKGWGRIIIGTTKNEVEEFLLDEGTLNSEHDNGYHIDYQKYGLQISYSFEDKVKFIAFFNNRFAYKYMNKISLKTNKNIDWNSTYKQVKEAYGKPTFDFSGAKDSFTYKTISFDDIDFVFENEKLVGINVYKKN